MHVIAWVKHCANAKNSDAFSKCMVCSSNPCTNSCATHSLHSALCICQHHTHAHTHTHTHTHILPWLLSVCLNQYACNCKVTLVLLQMQQDKAKNRHVLMCLVCSSRQKVVPPHPTTERTFERLCCSDDAVLVCRIHKQLPPLSQVLLCEVLQQPP